MTSGNNFSFVYAKSVVKDVEKIHSLDRIRIKEQIELLSAFPLVQNIKRLTNHPLADFRLRVGNYRVLFDVDFDNRKLFILKIGHRKDVY